MKLGHILRDRDYIIKERFYRATLTSKGFSESLADEYRDNTFFANNKNRWHAFEFKDKASKEIFFSLHSALFADAYEVYVNDTKINLANTDLDVIGTLQDEAYALHREQEEEKKRLAAERAKRAFDKKKNVLYGQIDVLLNPKSK